MDSTTSNLSGKASISELQIDAAAVPIVFRFGPIRTRTEPVEIALRKLHQACLDSPWLQKTYDLHSGDGRFEFATPEGGKYTGELSIFGGRKLEGVLYLDGYVDADGKTKAQIDDEVVIRFSCEKKGKKEYFIYLCLNDDTPSVMDFFEFIVQTALDRLPNVELGHVPLNERDAILHIPPLYAKKCRESQPSADLTNRGALAIWRLVQRE